MCRALYLLSGLHALCVKNKTFKSITGIEVKVSIAGDVPMNCFLPGQGSQ